MHRNSRGARHSVPFASVDSRAKNPIPPLTEALAGLSVVYYVRHKGYIKIGYSQNLAYRLQSLNYVPWRDVLAVEFGGRDLERQRHQEFAGDLAEGREWFHPSDALMAHIDGLRQEMKVALRG